MEPCLNTVRYSHSSYIPMSLTSLAARHFLFCSGAYGLLSQCLGEAVADTRPFDPYYFPLQTVDFNYQAILPAYTSSSAYLPRNGSAKEIRLISCNTAAFLRHFGSALPITAVENLTVYLLCLRSNTVTAGFLCVRRPSQVPTSKGECLKESNGVSVIFWEQQGGRRAGEWRVI